MPSIRTRSIARVLEAHDLIQQIVPSRERERVFSLTQRPLEVGGRRDGCPKRHAVAQVRYPNGKRFSKLPRQQCGQFGRVDRRRVRLVGHNARDFRTTLWDDKLQPDHAPRAGGTGPQTLEEPHGTRFGAMRCAVAERIERYASVVGRENVIAGTDCGFAQGWTMPRTHPSVQWAKLQALADGARLASQRLWGARTTPPRVNA